MDTSSKDLASKGMLADAGEHFRGRYEVERKFRVGNLAAMRGRLERLGATAFMLGNHEIDVFFDLPDGRLAQSGQSHVLREMRPSGRDLWIVKGPAADACVAMDLPDRSKAETMLRALGFEDRAELRKRRDIYFLDSVHVTLDDVGDLGTFVEVAAMTDDRDALPDLRSVVARNVRALGLRDGDEVQMSYATMMAAHRSERHG